MLSQPTNLIVWMNGKLLMKIKRNLVRDIIVMLVAIISFSISFVLNNIQLYHFFVEKYNLASQIHLTSAELMYNYRNLIKYLNFLGINHWIHTISSSSQALQHFADVKKLIQFNYLISLIFIPLAIYFGIQRYRNKQFWQYLIPLKVIGTILVMALFILIAMFDRFFIIFHKILFRNNDWIFNPITDPIIKALPPDFFQCCFLIVAFIVFIFGLIFYWLGKRELKNKV